MKIEDLEDYTFTKAQDRALAMLERALAACAKSGIALCGMDSDILAIPRRQAKARGYADDLVSHDTWQGAYVVEDSGAYTDSGGW